jgi:1,4-dihydroxy-2-naphthoyl-CoA hydrolase
MPCIFARSSGDDGHFRSQRRGRILHVEEATPMSVHPTHPLAAVPLRPPVSPRSPSLAPAYARLTDYSPAAFERWGRGRLSEALGIEMLTTEPRHVSARVVVRPAILAPHGMVHGGSFVAIADTLCGYGCVINLPAGAAGFVTIELKNNFLGSATDGVLRCDARPLHLGRNTQVWDAEITHERSQRLLTQFRCTQMVMWP